MQEIHPLSFYRECVDHPTEYVGDSQFLKEFNNEIDRKIRILKNTISPQDREPIQATFGGPGLGKSRLIDELANNLVKTRGENENIICLNVTYNYRTSPIQGFDTSSSESIARSAFLWRILANFSSEEAISENKILKRVQNNIENYTDISLDNVIRLISNHPSILKQIENNNKNDIDIKLILFIGIDEILKVNQELKCDAYVNETEIKGKKKILNSYNIVQTICSYYDRLYSFKKNKILVHFAISSLFRAGFGETPVPGRPFTSLTLQPLQEEYAYKLIELFIGSEWMDIFKTKLKNIIILCSGYPFAIRAVCDYIIENKIQPTTDDIKITSLRINLWEKAIKKAVDQRSQPEQYEKLFNDPNDLYKLLSYNTVPPSNQLRLGEISQRSKVL